MSDMWRRMWRKNGYLKSRVENLENTFSDKVKYQVDYLSIE